MFVKYLLTLINLNYICTIFFTVENEVYTLHFNDGKTDLLKVGGLSRGTADFVVRTLENSISRNETFFDVEYVIRTFRGAKQNE